MNGGIVTHMPNVGDVVRSTDDRWIVLPPKHCPNGHELAPRRVLVGHAPCPCDSRGGHTSWRCLECDALTYGPPLSEGCRPLAGPAAIR